MIQTIFLIMLVMQKTRAGIGFTEYLIETIDTDIKEFIPEGIDFIKCNTYSDFYIDNILNRVYGFESEGVTIPEQLTVEKNVLEITFSSEDDLMFKELPWLEEYMGDTIEYYDNLGVVFPYLIKDGGGYTFRLAYKMITPVSNEDASTLELNDDYSMFTDNGDFFKSHFYKEDVLDEYLPGIAKVLLLNKVKDEE